MSWRNKLAWVLIPVLLSGCGFQPLYGKNPSGGDDASKVFAGVKIDPISGRTGQELKANLEDRLNPGGALPSGPAYRLNIALSSSVVPIGVARDGTVSRYNVYITSKYTLYRNADGKAITAGDVGYVDSFNNLTNAYFSTHISEEDAMKRGIIELSELYRQRLATYLDAGAPVQDIKPAEAHTTSPYTPVLFGPTIGNIMSSRPVP